MAAGEDADKQTGGAKLSPWKALLPVLIGVVVVWLMFRHDVSSEDLREIWHGMDFSARTVGSIILACAFMFGRDYGLSWRFRALTDKQLTWKQAFKVDLLCEFTSCVTPSAVGGSSLGMVFLNSQGIEIGRATTLMITTLFLDELFFVIACPIAMLFTPASEIFASTEVGFSKGIELTFWLVYSGIFIWTTILFLGILVRPQWIRSVIVRLFSVRFLQRWKEKATELGDNMVAASLSLKTKPFIFWVEVFCGTALSWISRYLVVNALFFGFIPSADHSQWIILVRQLVLWVVLMVSPSPGGAGLSEWLFSGYYGDLVPTAGMVLILAILWRIISYYVYLAIGAVLVPRWISDTYNRIKHYNGKGS